MPSNAFSALGLTVPPLLRTLEKAHFVEPAEKPALLGRLLADPALSRVIVFTRTKTGANQVTDALETGGVRVAALHGNKSQPARQKALEQFRTDRSRVLAATDIASHGIDVTGISHAINFDLPAQPEDYVHRIRRTARAGARLQIAGGPPLAVQPQCRQAHAEHHPSRRRGRSTAGLRPAA